MTYIPYLIANLATGIDKRLQPWLIPDDAQEELLDGDIYRGVMLKRNGYKYFAIGMRGSAPYCESRMVNQIVNINMTGLINSSNQTYTTTLLTPVRRGTVVVTSSDPLQTVTDNGLGAFTGDGTGTVDYTTGAVSVTFTAAPTTGTVRVTYDYHPANRVMGIMNFITATNVKDLIVADTKRLNIYNSNTNRLEYLGRTLTITGITNASPGQVTTSSNHGLSDGDRVFIYGVSGMTQVNNTEFTITSTGANTFTIGVNTIPYSAYSSGGTVQLVYTGTSFNFFSWVNYPDKNGNPRLLFTNNKDQIGYYAPQLTPSVGDYINYPVKGSADFQMLTDAGATITTITALLLFVNKDRLLMLRTTENGVIKPQRIRISGTGVKCDDFETSATGAGFIDIPDGTWIQGAAFNRDDLIIFTESSTWVLKYTGNDTAPFVLNKIDETRGSDAPFGVITYLNRTSALSPRGLIISDGYRVERQDQVIPDFSFNEIYGANFQLCFAGVVDAERDHYLLYPPTKKEESQRILVTNYDEDNYGTYRYGMSCMGTTVTSFDTTWNDLLQFANWDEFANAYGDWNSFAYSAGTPISLGGGFKGEIWQINVTEEEDNPVKIRNITVIDTQTIEITTDWNNYSLNANVSEDDTTKGSDVIYIAGVNGMQEINEKQFAITSITTPYTVFRVRVPGGTSSLSAYTSGGEATRVIPFNAIMKQFNPFVDQDKKVRCGWLYMYVSVSGTDLRRNINVVNATQSNPCVITTNVNHNLRSGDQVGFIKVGGMTELNDNRYFITVIDGASFSLNGVNSTGYTAYTSGGYATAAELCKAEIQVITNDNPTSENTQLMTGGNYPYQGAVSNLYFETGVKKWYKIFINQTGQFIQFRILNQQSGANIKIHALMPGFQAVGRLL